MKTDPVLRRQYFWKVGNAALVRSHDAQNPDSRRDRELADYVLANLDRLVASGKTMDALDDFD
ncbi:MAG: hypothetical protein M9939_00625 [Mesorhizobium sp.]|nr:hypothetical protein [Mesorhizobium sp.]MCO5159611.1 hypothetical protein [Mesorhizobium sp.]